MRYKINTLLSTSLLLIATACSNKEETVEAPQTTIAPVEQVSTTNTTVEHINVQLTITETLDKENKLQISGETNLPDGMELILTIKNDNGYSAQDKVDIQSGEFTSGWFSHNGSPLSGDYNLKVTSPTANVQPIEVQKVIGESGVNLYGDQVKKDSTWGKMIEFSKEFNVPELISANHDKKISKVDEEVWNKIYEALDTGMYGTIIDIVEANALPDEDLVAIYHYALYHYYGQGGDDEKSKEYLNMIPADYSGKGAEYIAFTRYQNEHYDAADYEFIPLEEFVEKYYNPITNTDKAPLIETPFNGYTKEELESDPSAPSTDPRDYNANGEYVPHDGPSSNPADYDFSGNYRPIDEMTQAEIQAELESMLNRSIGQ